MAQFDTQPTAPKRKNRSPLRVIVNTWGCLLSLLMLGLGVVVGLAGAILFAPQLLGFNVTATALAEREIVLAATDADLNQRDREANQRATDLVRDNLSTQISLNNSAALLDQTATQSTRNIVATATADAAESARQRTQIALNFAATQAQLEQNATQIQLDFRNTQAALDGDSSFESQSVLTDVPTEAPPPTATPSPLPPTATVILLPPSDTPSPTLSPTTTFTPAPRVVEADFTQDAHSEDWQFEDESWSEETQGIQVISESAWLISRETWQNAYSLTVDIAPAVALESTYTVFFAMDNADTLAVHFDTSSLVVNGVQLVETASLLSSNPAADNVANIAMAEVDEPLTSATRIILEVDGATLTVHLNDEVVLSTELPENRKGGKVGVQLPLGAILQKIAVQED